MGLWSAIGGIVDDFIPGAGTVGSKVGEAVDLAGKVIGDSGKVSAQNQQLKHAQDLERQKIQDELDRTKITSQIAKQNGQVSASDAAIAQQKAQDEARMAANKAAVRGALEKHIQDVSFNRGGLSSTVPEMHFSGGLRPSAFGPELAAAGDVLNKSGQNSLEHPPTFPTIDPVTAVQPKAEVPPAPDETIWEKLAGPLSLGLTIAGQVAKGHAANGPQAPTIASNAPTGSDAQNIAGATGITDADLAALLARAWATQPASTDPTLGQGVTFGPGVIPAQTPEGTGLFNNVTFGGG